jgi:hypothetical protein
MNHTKKWEELTREEQNLYLTLLWNDNHSEQAIADFFATTKGPIVGRRQRVLALQTAGRLQKDVKRVVDPERFRDLIHLHEMAEIEKAGMAAIAALRTEFAADMEVTPVVPPELRCQWPLTTPRPHERRSLCGKRVKEGHKVCEEHFALLNKRRPLIR